MKERLVEAMPAILLSFLPQSLNVSIAYCVNEQCHTDSYTPLGKYCMQHARISIMPLKTGARARECVRVMLLSKL